MPLAYLGIGSNLGDRAKNISMAIKKINRIKSTKVTKISSIRETDPVSSIPQGKFLNAAIEINTSLLPKELLINLQSIESELGRVRSERNAPRTIDLDILLYGNLEINEKDLIIPHPRMNEREFVLIPLKEIAPAPACNLGGYKYNRGLQSPRL
jgi:2-amino-4-hydroxy-6-hydroxymethyldihydropteridine diphosphokinase